MIWALFLYGIAILLGLTAAALAARPPMPARHRAPELRERWAPELGEGWLLHMNGDAEHHAPPIRPSRPQRGPISYRPGPRPYPLPTPLGYERPDHRRRWPVWSRLAVALGVLLIVSATASALLVHHLRARGEWFQPPATPPATYGPPVPTADRRPGFVR